MSTAGRSVRFVGPREVEVTPVEPGEPAPTQVLVETRVSAISAGTELLVYAGELADGTVLDEELPSLDGEFSYPLRYGYAAVGEVVEVGQSVDRAWLGRRVFGFNPHESHFLARPEELIVVPDGVDTEAGALFANTETALNFVLDGAPRLGETVAVFGQGAVGLLTTALVSATGVETIVAVEPLARRRELALAMGADVVVDPDASGRDPAAGVRQHTVGVDTGGADAVAGDEVEGGVDLAIEVSGRPSTLEAAVGATRFGGRVLVGSWYGTRRAEIGLDEHFHRDRIAIESSQVSTVAPELRGRWDRDRRRRVTWEQLARLDVERLVTDRVDVDAAPEAYRRLLDRPDETVQVLLTY